MRRDEITIILRGKAEAEEFAWFLPQNDGFTKDLWAEIAAKWGDDDE